MSVFSLHPLPAITLSLSLYLPPSLPPSLSIAICCLDWHDSRPGNAQLGSRNSYPKCIDLSSRDVKKKRLHEARPITRRGSSLYPLFLSFSLFSLPLLSARLPYLIMLVAAGKRKTGTKTPFVVISPFTFLLPSLRRGATHPSCHSSSRDVFIRRAIKMNILPTLRCHAMRSLSSLAVHPPLLHEITQDQLRLHPRRSRNA